MYVIFGINTISDISKLSQIPLAQRLVKLRITIFEISLVVFMPNITTNHAITYTKLNRITDMFWAKNTV